MIHVVKATVRIRLPIVCSACGLQAFSLPIAVEIADTELGELPGILARHTRTVLPVGWASYHGIPQDRLICPACPHP